MVEAQTDLSNLQERILAAMLDSVWSTAKQISSSVTICENPKTVGCALKGLHIRGLVERKLLNHQTVWKKYERRDVGI